MAKEKARTTGYGRPVAYGEDGATWSVDGLVFVFRQGVLNGYLFRRAANGLDPLCVSNGVRQAGFFAEGFAAGLGTIK